MSEFRRRSDRRGPHRTSHRASLSKVGLNDVPGPYRIFNYSGPYYVCNCTCGWHSVPYPQTEGPVDEYRTHRARAEITAAGQSTTRTGSSSSEDEFSSSPSSAPVPAPPSPSSPSVPTFHTYTGPAHPPGSAWQAGYSRKQLEDARKSLWAERMRSEDSK